MSALPRFALVTVLTVFTLLLWLGLPQLGNVAWVFDNTWFKGYAQTLGTEHRIPREDESLEYTLPPATPALAALSRGVAKAVGPVDVRVLDGLPRPVRVVGWLALALGAAWSLLSGTRRRLGLGLAAAAAALAALDVVSAATSIDWVAYVLPSLPAEVGLVGAAALLARETWPGARWAPALAAFGTALLPFVYRMGVLLHPDPLFSVCAVLAFWLTLRASRRGWTSRAGVAAGLLLAVAAWTRQSAVLIVGIVGLTAVLLGRRRCARFLAGAAAAVVLVAGPWWGYQASKYGNPIQSNLDRPGLMLDHQPPSFFFDVPADTIAHPLRVLNRNVLLPKFHVGLWSDWTGVGGFGEPESARARALAVSQSVLGLGGDLLVLGGLVFCGVPTLWRVLRRREANTGLAAVTLYFLVSWAAYLTMLIRFPQRDADPNSPHYLLFLAPAAAVLAVAAARAVWARRPARFAVLAWALLYTASWALVLELMISP